MFRLSTLRLLSALAIAGGTLAAPVADAVLNPPDEAVVTQTHIQFEWPPIPGAAAYELEIFRLVEGSPPVLVFSDDAIDAMKPRRIVTTGLEFGETYDWQVGEAGGSPGPMHRFSVDEIPSYFDPAADITAETFGIPEPGLTLFGVETRDTPKTIPDGFAIAVDVDGNVVWYMRRDQRVRDLRVLDDGRIQFLQADGRAYKATVGGNTSWASPDDPDNFYLHHEAYDMPNGDVLSLAYTFRDFQILGAEGLETQTWKGDNIVVFDHSTNNVRWFWSAFDRIAPLENLDPGVMNRDWCPGCPAGNETFANSRPWSHANAAVYNQEDDSVYVSLRHLARNVRIDFATGNIVYSFGGAGIGGVPAGGTVSFSDASLYSWSHAPELQPRVGGEPQGNILIFDNGTHRTVSQGEPRLLELSFSGDPIDNVSIDWVTWLKDEFDEPYSASFVGDADRQPGGTTIATMGPERILLEVDDAGNHVWRLTLPSDERSFLIYRSERIPGIVVDTHTDLDGDGSVDISDNCPDHPNPSQNDCDLDGMGDLCAVALGLVDEENCAHTLPEYDIDLIAADGNENYCPEFSGAAGVWRVKAPGQPTQLEYFGQSDSPFRITDPAFDNGSQRVSGERAVWVGSESLWVKNCATVGFGATGQSETLTNADESAMEIFYYDGANRKRVTDNDLADRDPEISGARIVWSGDDRETAPGPGAMDSDIFFRDMESADGTQQMTENLLEDDAPDISGSRVIWRSRTADESRAVISSESDDPDIFGDDTLEKTGLVVSGSWSAWRAFDGSDWEIFFSDGTDTHQLTDDDTDDSGPQVSDAGLVWQSGAGISLWKWEWELGSDSPLALSAAGSSARISASSVVWVETPAADDSEIMLWNLVSENLSFSTINAEDDQNPAISGDDIAWERVVGDARELRLHDSVNLDAKLADDGFSPALSDSYVAWVQYGKNPGRFLVEERERDIWVYDRNAQTTRIVTDDDLYCDGFPKLSGSSLVYEQRPYDDDDSSGSYPAYCTGLASLVYHDLSDDSSYALPFCSGSQNTLLDVCQGSLSGTRVAWRDDSGTSFEDSEIMLFDASLGLSESSISQITTDNRRDEVEPALDTDRIAWLGFPEPDWELYYDDGSEILRLTDDTLDVDCPVIDGSRVAWVGRRSDDDGSGKDNGQIFLFNGRETVALTDNQTHVRCPSVSGSRVTWSAGQSSSEELYLYDGREVVQLTSDGFRDHDPQISGAGLLWQKQVGIQNHVYYYNGSSAMPVTQDDTYDLRIAGARAVWTHNSASSVSPPREIFHADPIVEVVPEPVLGLLQLGALVALARARRERGKRVS